MENMQLKTKKHYLLLFISFALILAYFNETLIFKLHFWSLNESYFHEVKKIYFFESDCECRRWEKIGIESLPHSGYLVFSIDTRKNLKHPLYKLSSEEFSDSIFTCALFSALRRGKKQKVISYSIFGNNSFYFSKLETIGKQVKEFYPDWSIRVYYDNSTEKSIICQNECSPEDNIDFCNVNSIKLSLKEGRNYSDLSYILPRMWRFLAFGDSFVDLFLSRDSDSFILKREVDAVNVWINSSKIGHIMRDHPHHGVQMLAGMWGIKSGKAQTLIKKFRDLLTNADVAKRYNPFTPWPKGGDQAWLSHHVWADLKRVSIIHDSFFCKHADLGVGSSPWPTKRSGDCYVGSVGNCNHSDAIKHIECPIDCRPANHLDWTYC